MPLQNPLAKSQIDEFKRNGVLVVKKAFRGEEIDCIRSEYHTSLFAKAGVEHRNLIDTAGGLSSLSSTGGSGGVLDIFYEHWKLRIAQDPRIFSTVSQLWSHTYASYPPESDFVHPFGPIDASRAYMMIDRVCYRVPDEISELFKDKKKRHLQRSLTPHLDCCPHRMYDSDKEFPSWRPIQCFLALTDTLEPEMGGFECYKGFHKQFEVWARGRATQSNDPTMHAPCVGDFTPIRPIEDRDVLQGMQHIACEAGDLVCWDYRIPHANSRFNRSNIPREAVYLGFLPYIERNKAYATEQLRRYRAAIVPGDQWHDHSKTEDVPTFGFSQLGQLMMAIEDDWGILQL